MGWLVAWRGGGGRKDESFLLAGCWIAVMEEFGKECYQHGHPSQVMWGVNFGWIQESVYLLTMLLPAKSRWYYVGSWMYCKLVGLSVVSSGCVVVSLNY